jgi:phospholipid/cholesterol/gamma-HCH transport system substrate-binding protein
VKTEAKVGLFVTIGLVLLFLLSTQVNKFQGFGKKGYDVEAIVSDASGLERHAKVKMKGVEIGYVKDISLSGTKVVLTLFIYRNAKIPSDSQVLLTQESLLGGKYINIVPGSADRYLSENGTLTREKPMATLDEMGTQVAEAAEELKGFIHELRETLDPESREHLRNTFNNLDTLMQDLKEVVSNNKEGVDRLVKNINEAAEKFGRMSEKFSGSADTINADLPDIMTKLQKTLDSFQGVGETLNTKLPKLADKFESLEDQLDLVIRENRKPLNSALTSVDGFFKKGQGTIDKLDDYLDSVTQSRLDLGLDSNYLANDGKIKGGMHIDYMPTYTRHYMLDIVSGPDYSELVNGRYPAELDHQNGKFFVSAQIGKRFEDFLVRGGLIESTAGAGIDYFTYYDKLKFSFDAYDFSAVNDIRGDKPHLRATMRYRFYKHIDAYLGADNFLNTDASNIFFGMGVSFEDDRIKYLLGAGASAGASAAQ